MRSDDAASGSKRLAHGSNLQPVRRRCAGVGMTHEESRARREEFLRIVAQCYIDYGYHPRDAENARNAAEYALATLAERYPEGGVA
jgi:hypothetical protein